MNGECKLIFRNHLFIEVPVRVSNSFFLYLILKEVFVNTIQYKVDDTKFLKFFKNYFASLSILGSRGNLERVQVQMERQSKYVCIFPD